MYTRKRGRRTIRLGRESVSLNGWSRDRANGSGSSIVPA